MNVEIGYRVIRAPDWDWEDQDGGDGHVGTVVEVGHIGNRFSPDKTVIVQWDNGRRTNYRVGYKGAYDLLVFDGAPSGVKHFNKRCDGCGRRGIKGIRWQCTQCEDYDLCTRCYMDNVHDIQHKFRRFLTNKSTGVLIPKRASCTRSQANGIFPGAKVVRGHDWLWGDQDGGNGAIGTITDTRGWQNESDSSVATVAWPGQTSNVYRVGHRGKVDIKYVTPGKGPMYYKEHLPVLGKDELDASLVPPTKPCPFAIGDRVRVSLPVEVLKMMQKGHGGWNPKMADLIDKVGVVHRITQAGDIRIQYRNPPVTSSGSSNLPSSDNNRWTFNLAALTRVRDDTEGHHFLAKDHVRVIDDYDRVKSHQSSEHGNWNEKMAEVLGQKGVIVEVYSDGDVRVKFPSQRGPGSPEWTFNPACLVYDPPRQRGSSSNNEKYDPLPVVTNGASSEPTTEKRAPPVATEIINKAVSGDLQNLKQLLHRHPDMIDCQWKGCTALQLAAFNGRVEILNFLLRKKAKISITDEEGDSALHYAMFCKNNNKEECVRIILKEATTADVNLVNVRGNSPLHVAVSQNNIEWANFILALGCDVNKQDIEGDTAAHYCVINCDNSDMMQLLLSQPNFDPEINNKTGFNILHIVAQKGKIAAMKAISEKFPDLARCVKDDGFTPLHLSALNNRQLVTQLLVQECPFLINEGDLKNQTPLHLAVFEGHAMITDILVRGGAFLDIRRKDGKSCLDAALEQISKPTDEGNSSNFSTIISEFSETLTLSTSTNEDFSLDDSLPSTPEWNEVRNILVRNRLTSFRNVQHLAIACFLVRSGADLSSGAIAQGGETFELVTDPKARTALQECNKYRTKKLLALEYSNQVDLTEEPVAGKLMSPTPITAESLPSEARASCSRRSPHKDAEFVPSYNFVTSAEDDSFGTNNVTLQECMSCTDEMATVIFRPCGHKLVCLECCVRMKKCIKCHCTITAKEDAEGKDLSLPPPTPSVCKSLVSVDQQKTLLKLEQKVRELQESNQCVICMERQRDTALRCGHRFCQKCASTLRKHCPMCRKPITGTIRLY